MDSAIGTADVADERDRPIAVPPEGETAGGAVEPGIGDLGGAGGVGAALGLDVEGDGPGQHQRPVGGRYRAQIAGDADHGTDACELVDPLRHEAREWLSALPMPARREGRLMKSETDGHEILAEPAPVCVVL